MLYYILVVTFYNVATRWNLRYLSNCYLFGAAAITVWLFFFVVLTIQISQQPLKLTVLPPLNYKHNHLSISCISKSNFFVMILSAKMPKLAKLLCCFYVMQIRWDLELRMLNFTACWLLHSFPYILCICILLNLV